MRAVWIKRYGAAGDALEVTGEAPEPFLRPGEILIRVAAASLNPIDVQRRTGYGRSLLGALGAARLPMIPGRDCSGVVAEVGAGVRRFQVGDRVWTAPDPLDTGTHADFVAVREGYATHVPGCFDEIQAAAVPYAGLTAWSALVRTAGLGPGRSAGKRVLVHGGTGGIGSLAIQMLKAWDAEVATTCRGGAVTLAYGLGADHVIDFETTDFSKRLSDYDVVFDIIGGPTRDRSFRVLKPCSGHLVTVVSPLLPLADRFGLALGLPTAAADLAARKTRAALPFGRRFDWAFVRADGEALEHFRQLAERGALKPLIDRVFPLEEVAAAHTYFERGGVRGKVVLRVSGETFPVA